MLIGSADLMPRNLDTRVELVVPVEDPVLRDDLLDTLERALRRRHELLGPGARRRAGAPVAPPPSPSAAVQRELMVGHTARAAERDPSRTTERRPPARRLAACSAGPGSLLCARACAGAGAPGCGGSRSTSAAGGDRAPQAARAGRGRARRRRMRTGAAWPAARARGALAPRGRRS